MKLTPRIFSGIMWWCLAGVGLWILVGYVLPERTRTRAARVARLHGAVAELEHTDAESLEDQRELDPLIAERRGELLAAERRLSEARADKAEVERQRRTLRTWVVIVTTGLSCLWILATVFEHLRRTWSTREPSKAPRRSETHTPATAPPVVAVSQPPVESPPAPTVSPQAMAVASPAQAPRSLPPKPARVELTAGVPVVPAMTIYSSIPGPGGTTKFFKEEIPASMRMRSPEAPLPDHGITGDALRGYWRGLVAEYRRYKGIRDAPPEHKDCDDCRKRRFEYKVEMRHMETIMRWLHEIIAPGTPVCEEDCAHTAGGATPQQAKAFIDRLQRDIDEADVYLDKKPDATWAMDERDSSSGAKSRFSRLLQS